MRRFLEAAGLPHGQLKLKEYVGGSFINSMWESAANRKRQNVVSVLDNFPDSKFILVGDSGEQGSLIDGLFPPTTLTVQQIWSCTLR